MNSSSLQTRLSDAVLDNRVSLGSAYFQGNKMSNMNLLIFKSDLKLVLVRSVKSTENDFLVRLEAKSGRATNKTIS